jgi:acyl-CoA reductase-like NAD-dependent aldehyde dehydrogenase
MTGLAVEDARMTIGGELVGAARTIEVVDPADESVIAQAPDCDQEQLDSAFGSAADAQHAWWRSGEARRADLSAAADRFDESIQVLAGLLSAEQGKTIADAAAELRAAAAILRYFVMLEVPDRVLRDDSRSRVVVRRRPLGVVAAITPWNFPVHLAMSKVAPALAAGNTVVLKPSPYTPLTTLRIGQLFGEVLPPGVLNVVSGGDELGSWMTAHPVPRKVSFTGSVATGKHVAASAASDLKRTTLELGGNDPAIVLDDCDVARAADRIFWGAFANSGQICAAIKRVYVARNCYAELAEALAARARAVRVGRGTEPGVQLGPVNNRPQFDRVTQLVDDALAHGAVALAGGRPGPGRGYFFAPTVLTEVSDGVRIVDEEQFGPVLPLIPYDDVDEAIERANSTHFGLSASVWSGDEDAAIGVADQLECGTVWVNTHLAYSPDQPISGVKWSCLGAENGVEGYLSYTDLQVQHVRHR